jgi:hypothetical protein
MPERRPPDPEREPALPAPPPDDSAYSEDEEAEVRKRLEDLGYVE